MVQLLREINHENVVKLVNVHINHADMSLYLAFDYAEHDLYVSVPLFLQPKMFLIFFFRRTSNSLNVQTLSILFMHHISMEQMTALCVMVIVYDNNLPEMLYLQLVPNEFVSDK